LTLYKSFIFILRGNSQSSTSEPNETAEPKDEVSEYTDDIEFKNSKGYAAVHLWVPDLRNRQVGHLALTLSNGLHISFWPAPEGSTEQSSYNTLGQDIEAEGRIPDEVAFIPNYRLREDKILNWWKKYRKEKIYKLRKCNCATTVYDALSEGGFGKDQQQWAEIVDAAKKANSELLKEMKIDLPIGKLRTF
jgi:hypothetical protein